MRDFKAKFAAAKEWWIEKYWEKYGPKILSISMHAIFILLLLWSNSLSKFSNVPEYIEVRIGSPFKTGHEETREDLNLTQPAQRYVIWSSSPTENMVEEIEPQPIKEVVIKQDAKLPQHFENMPTQKQSQKQRQIREKYVEVQRAEQGKGVVNGNSNKGKETATYLEWLQLTVQEMSQIPSQAREQNISGRAVLRLTFNRDGYVRDYELVRTTGSKLLDAAALRVARRLVTEPFPPMPTEFEQGKVWVTYDFPISFTP